MMRAATTADLVYDRFRQSRVNSQGRPRSLRCDPSPSSPRRQDRCRGAESIRLVIALPLRFHRFFVVANVHWKHDEDGGETWKETRGGERADRRKDDGCDAYLARQDLLRGPSCLSDVGGLSTSAQRSIGPLCLQLYRIINWTPFFAVLIAELIVLLSVFCSLQYFNCTSANRHSIIVLHVKGV